MTALAFPLLALGLLFYAAGTLGLLRFPDVHSRLHALTKADNLGLGFLAAGVGLLLGDGWSAARLLLIWLLAMFSAATVAQLIARSARPGPQ
jgi:multicomponent Na+:H+ antiporter subunit G